MLHGGPRYLQLVGSRRLSTELGDLIEQVNKDDKLGFQFMTTDGHADYHQLTDEPQYIDYDHMADISQFVFASALKVANLDHRVVVDKPKPDPKGRCMQ